MNVVLRAFCWTVLKLDYIPRYGRLYSIELGKVGGRTRIVSKSVKWKYQKFGRWGFNMLVKLKLLWPYLKYHNPDI